MRFQPTDRRDKPNGDCIQITARCPFDDRDMDAGPFTSTADSQTPPASGRLEPPSGRPGVVCANPRRNLGPVSVLVRPDRRQPQAESTVRCRCTTLVLITLSASADHSTWDAAMGETSARLINSRCALGNRFTLHHRAVKLARVWSPVKFTCRRCAVEAPDGVMPHQQPPLSSMHSTTDTSGNHAGPRL